MSRISKSLIAASLITFVLLSGVRTRAQKVGWVVIKSQVHLDDAASFDFGRLSVLVQHRRGKYHSWTTDGSFVPDANGQFFISVPAGNWISMEVTTSDPTIKHAADASGNEDLGFYELKRDTKKTVLLKEFYVPADSSPQMDQTIELHRSAAFSLCIPEGMRSGSVQFYSQAEKHQNLTRVLSFSDVETVRLSLIGGLGAGRWNVLYVDDNDQIRRSERLNLSSGQVLQVDCSKREPLRATINDLGRKLSQE